MKRRVIGQPNDAEDAIEHIVDALLDHALDNVVDFDSSDDDDDAVDVDDTTPINKPSSLGFTCDSQPPSPWVRLASCLHELDDLAVRDVTGTTLNLRKLRRDLDDLVSILATESVTELVDQGESRSSPRIRAWQDAQILMADPLASLNQIIETAQWALAHSGSRR